MKRFTSPRRFGPVCLGGVAVLLLFAAHAECAGRNPAPARPQVTATYAAPYAGHYNHAQLNPQFRWGWFGAEHFYPRVQWHRDYNGELMRWSQQRRY